MFFFTQTVFQKRLKVVFGIVAAGIIMMCAAAAAETGVITINRLNLREKPHKNARVIDVLDRNTQIKIHRRINGWLEISTGTRRGFIRHLPAYVRIEKAATPSPELGRLKAESEALKHQIEATDATITALLSQEDSVLNALEKIDLSITQARQRIRQVKSEMGAIERKLKQTRRASAVLKKNIAENERYAARRLVALYKLHWIGPTNLLATAESIFDLSQRKAALEKIFSHDQATLESLQDDKNRLSALSEDLNRHKNEHLALKATYAAQIEQLKGDRRTRNLLLSRVLNQKALNLAAISELKIAATALDTTIAALARQPPPQPLPVKPAAKPKPKKAAAPDVKPAPKPMPTSKPKPKPFIAYKGLLQLPVKGKIISNFGKFTNRQFNLVNFRAGIDIQCRRGEPIRAVFGGNVVYSAWFKGYGNMVIIDHGQHYYTVYAHAEDLFKTKGTPVTTGEVIATVGDSGALKGPGLYFEIRHRGKPIDPLVWIKRS